jgi:anti-anti-sigma factor
MNSAAADTRPDRTAVARERPPPGTLVVSVERRGAVVALNLSGDLDMATAPRVGEAMAWLRASSGPGTTIVIDTTDVDFIAAAGYRAVRASLVGPNHRWDSHVALIVGPAVARLETAISAASGPGDGSDAIEPGELVGVADRVDVRDPTILDGKAHCGGELVADVDPDGR